MSTPHLAKARASAVLFLASENASWITGQALAVDGGFSAGVVEDI